MSNNHYRRSVEDLEKVASKFWPDEISEKEAQISIIPLLTETQDTFVSILSVPVSDLQKIFTIVEASTMPANLFLKHLMILADFGGEMLQRLCREFRNLFPYKNLSYIWIVNGQSEERTYTFIALPDTKTLNNQKLGISGKKLLEKQPLTDLHKDIIAILLLGSMATDPQLAHLLSKCEISHYVGQPERLDRYIRQRYIWVSRITGGSQSNSLGQIAQEFVRRFLAEELETIGVEIISNGTMPYVRHSENEKARATNFDLVVKKNDKYVAIEISFQVTTNSVIERKAGQARSRYEQIELAGYKIAYVLDGSGNFQRHRALQTICNYSHCTVAFSRSELRLLCQFISDYLTERLA